MIFFLIFLVGIILIIFSVLISYKLSLDKDMMSSFECGFDPFLMVRTSFSLHFFKICLVFVFFDIEIIIILPLPFLMGGSFFFFFLFFLILVVVLLGLFFEWSQGSIDWFY